MKKVHSQNSEELDDKLDIEISNRISGDEINNALIINEISDRISEDNEIRSLISTGNSSINISTTETNIGKINLFGVEYDLYQCLIELTDIPLIANESKTITISEIPLGFNLYLYTKALVVAKDSNVISGDFYNDHYKINRLFIDSDLATKFTITCLENVDVPVKATVQVEYIKDFGSSISLTVTVPAEIDPADVNLSFPKLKYNKKNVASISVDDSAPTWNNIFSVINKRWVDDELLSYFFPGDTRKFTYHKDFAYVKDGVTYSRTNGSYPTKFCEYTDGAGVRHRYAFSLSCWWWKLAPSNETDNLPTAISWGTINRNFKAGWAFPWTSADEVRFMQDFGVSIDYHDLYPYSINRTKGFNDVTQEQFNQEVKYSSDKFYELIDRRPKTGSQPNGDPIYDRFSECPNISFRYMGENHPPYTGIFYKPFSPQMDLDSKYIMPKRKFIAGGYTLNSFKDDIAASASAEEANRVWEILGLHTPYRDSGYFEFFPELESLYGASGDDSLWVASIDEVFEYWYMTNYAAVHKSINGQEIKFKIYVPCGSNFYFRSISCLLSGINTTNGLLVNSSDNCKGMSFGINDSKLLVNLDFNEDLISKVEKYLSIFEANPGEEYAYDNAEYFIQQLKVGVKETYQARLNAFVSPPTLTAVVINSGAESTTSKNVTVNISLIGGATQIILGEEPNFVGSSWEPFSTSKTITLSDGFGSKTVYVQLRNSFGLSDVLSDSISLVDTSLGLSSIVINGGASVTNISTISVDVVYSGDPIQMMLSESPTFEGASWVNFAATVQHTLSSGYGVKTIYCRLKDSTTTTSVVSSSIEYSFVEVSELESITINNGDSNTDSQVVSVNMIYSGDPTHYRISESETFTDSSWITLSSSTVNFTLSPTLGLKTLYVQIQDSGGMSSVKSSSITLLGESVKAALAFNYQYGNGTLAYDSDNELGVTVNSVHPTVGTTTPFLSPKPLKDTSGNDLTGWFLSLNKASYPALDSVALEGMGLSSFNTGITEGSGPYPIKYLTKVASMGITSGVSLQGRLVFTLPVGAYKAKIIYTASVGGSLSESERVYCWYRIVANGISSGNIQVGPDGFTGLHNSDFNAEIQFNVETNSSDNVVLFIWNNNPVNMGYRPGLSLIEIQKLS